MPTIRSNETIRVKAGPGPEVAGVFTRRTAPSKRPCLSRQTSGRLPHRDALRRLRLECVLLLLLIHFVVDGYWVAETATGVEGKLWEEGYFCVCVVYICVYSIMNWTHYWNLTCHDSFPFLSFLIPFEPVSYYYNCFRILCSKKRRDKGEGWRQRREKKGGRKGGGEEEKEEEEESRGPEGKGSWEPK